MYFWKFAYAVLAIGVAAASPIALPLGGSSLRSQIGPRGGMRESILAHKIHYKVNETEAEPLVDVSSITPSSLPSL
ncbi:hypothetical protein PsYK624_000800 [Phanerochaete sordida]|uniref:Uncharacterized protein n=1 Tax=Phanerochaete sordida TaxID=48140 RepID=A0A9P3FWQ3_9APHY|nr:hypothetical protein PsYK624_000800 [Phanerochaete sordida]